MEGWSRRLGEEVQCARCREVRDSTELDRMLWCPVCLDEAHKAAGRAGAVAGVLAAALVAVWIWLSVRPSAGLIPGAWIATLVATGWLAGKLAREIAFGLLRARA